MSHLRWIPQELNVRLRRYMQVSLGKIVQLARFVKSFALSEITLLPGQLKRYVILPLGKITLLPAKLQKHSVQPLRKTTLPREFVKSINQFTEFPLWFTIPITYFGVLGLGLLIYFTFRL